MEYVLKIQHVEFFLIAIKDFNMIKILSIVF